jgi:Xaa-Pro aminopeptidase/Xaa-Pro dipeptidase
MSRIKEVFNKIKDNNLDAFLFSKNANVFYLTHFNSSNAYVVLTDKEKYFFTDARYFEGAKEKLKDWNVILLTQGLKELKEFLQNFGKIGFEKDHFTIDFFERFTLNTNLKDKLIGFSGFLNDIRISKTEEEINIIKEAVRQIDTVFLKILDEILHLKTELDVRRRIINHIFEEGGEGESFTTIVASGKHSAVPHWETSHEPIQWNNLLLIDMGSRYKGYCSDFTRTVFLGKVDKELEKIYHIVKEANEAATEAVKAGISIKEIDLAARNVIEKAGYGEYFIHSTGHGIGVEIHEEPRIYKNNEEILKENTVFTIEPGIYIPNKGGVRLENIVVARKNKAEVITKTSLNPVYIGS